MKQITLILVLAFTIGLNAQTTVDPEVFPMLNKTSVVGKNLYTNTGGEGKISIDTIFSSIHDWVTNGLSSNGIDSMKLGGDLIENTTITQNGNQLFIDNGALSGNGSGMYSNIENSEKATGIEASLGNLLVLNQSTLDTVTNILINESVSADISIPKFISYSNQISPTEHRFQLECTNFGTNNYLGMRLTDADGFIFTPRNTGIGLIYNNQFMFSIENTSGIRIFGAKPNGTINLLLLSYDNDADAGANGLVTGDQYQLSTTNTLGLPAGVNMTKQ